MTTKRKSKAKAKPAATTTPAKGTKPATEQLRERKLRRLAKEHPYRPGTALAKMAALVQDGMTVAELTAAMRKAGMKQSPSGFVSNAVARKFLAVE